MQAPVGREKLGNTTGGWPRRRPNLKSLLKNLVQS
jgi:hypothetical protein